MQEQTKESLSLLAGGDVGSNFEPVDSLAELVLPVLQQADLRFSQCERIYSERGVAPLGNIRLLPRMASIWQTAGIDIVSMAGNHAMDSGPDAMFDTIELFRKMGKHVVGVGRNEEEARAPVIVERNGVKIAFLACCSVITEGHEATKAKPGMVPMRAYTYYQRGKDQTEQFHPGTPPAILTIPDENDLHALQQDIRKAKQQADAVVLSAHWGLHVIPKTICDYQPQVAHAAIDAGADLILGHHAHCLKAIEVYKGKVCFYSLGNFMVSSRPSANNKIADWNKWKLYWYRLDGEEYLSPDSLYRYAPHCRYTMLAKCVFNKKGVERVSFLPAFINARAQPAVVISDNPRFQEVVDFMEWSSDGFPHKFLVESNEVVVES